MIRPSLRHGTSPHPRPSRTTRATPLALTALALATLPLGACVRTGAVAAYATSASKATSQFPSLANDGYQSCIRFERYEAESTSADLASDSALAVRCAGRDSAVKRVLAMNRVLDGYLSALSSLANDKVVEHDTPLADYKGALKAMDGLDADKINAVASLAGFVTAAATDGYRRSKVRQAIDGQNGNVALVTDALRDIVDHDFRTALDVERDAALSYYRTAIARGAAREPAAVVLVRDQCDDRLEAIRQKEAALDDYVKALRTIRTGHQKLYEARGHFDGVALASALASYAKQMDQAAQALDKAY